MKGVVGGLVRVQEPNDGTTKTPRKKSKLDALRETWATWVFRMASLTTLGFACLSITIWLACYPGFLNQRLLAEQP